MDTPAQPPINPVVNTPSPPVTPPSPVVQQYVASQQEVSPPSQNSSKKISIFLGVIILLLVFVGAGVFVLLNNQKSTPATLPIVEKPVIPTAAISGFVDFNGVAPSGSLISIEARKIGESQAQTVVSGISVLDGQTWNFSSALPGVPYELQAFLTQNGQVVAKSDTLIAAAPASFEILRINAPIATQSPSILITPTSSVATVSGTIGINGYIPTGSVVSIGSRKQGDSQFATVVSGITALDGAVWNFSSANSGQIYDFQASLISNGKVIGQSAIVTISAPAASEVLNITSSVKPPKPPVVGISGTFNINGNLSSNSYLTLGLRKKGEAVFQSVGGNIPASDNASWSVTTATAGAIYDVQAYLWVNNIPFAQSQIITVTAPAANEIFTINATAQPTTPSASSITASCGGQQNGNFQAIVNYNVGAPLQNAGQYQITVGTASQNNNVYTTTFAPVNPNQQQSLNTTYSLTSGVTYYIQYAYASCSTCSTFSPFSPSVQLTCR